MAPYIGDYDTTETVRIPFNTFTSDDPAASCTITDLAASDVEIHKDGSTTQRASDSGVSVAIDFDGVTGNHFVIIDLSDDADAGFYASGSRYAVRIEGVTIDGGTVNAWIGTFSIGCVLRPTTAGRKLDVNADGEAGIDWGNVGNKTSTVALTATTINDVSTKTGYTAAPTAGSIAAASFDNSTAFPLASQDTGATAVARTGADSDTLETLSDQLDTIETAVASLYWCVVRHTVNDTTGQDEWTLIPMKDGVAQTSATLVTLTVTKRSDGTALINAQSATQIGATSVWKYTASTSERINDGTDSYVAVVTFTCDAASRTAPPVIIARDG